MTSFRPILPLLMLATALAGCPANPGPTDTGMNDTGAGTDAGSDAMDSSLNCNESGVAVQEGDSGACYRAQACNGQPFCPALLANNPMSPNFVITQLEIKAPAALSAIGGILNSSIASGDFFWGAQFDLMNNTLRTGALRDGVMPGIGSGFLLSQFQFFMDNALPPGSNTRWNPQSAPLQMGTSGYSTMSPLSQLTIPVFSVGGDAGVRSLLTELPLRNVNVKDVRMSSDRNCIGTSRRAQFVSCASPQWATTDSAMVPFGVIEGVLTTEDARAIRVEQLGNKTLCEIIASSPSIATAADCTDANLNMLAAGKKPDSASPLGWTLRANFAAVSANIQ